MLQIMITFSKQQMAVLSAETGFLRDNLEKVLRLSEILSSFEHNAMLNSRFVLKDGTAINLTIFECPASLLTSTLTIVTIVTEKKCCMNEDKQTQLFFL